MSSVPSPLKSPTPGISRPAQVQSCHFVFGPKAAPVERFTQASPNVPRVQLTMSSFPSPLKSPTPGISSPVQASSAHFWRTPNALPEDKQIHTSPEPPRVQLTRSALPSPLKSPTDGISS